MRQQEQDAAFYGWWVVFGAFSILFLVFGAAYSFPAFFDALADEFSGSRGDIAAVFSVCGLLFFSVGAITGPIADKTDPRWVIGLGIILCGAGLIGASLAQELWQVLLAFGLGVGLGVGCAYVPSVGPVQRWFVRRRGFASGLAVSGIGFGTFATPLLATALMAETSWRTTYQIMGGFTLLLGAIATLMIVASPERKGQVPDGKRRIAVPEAAPAEPQPAPPGYGLREALGTRPFVLLYLGTFVMSFPLFVPFVHLVPYTMDLGYAKPLAVTVASMIGVGSIVGRFLLGGAADRFGRRQSLIATFVGLTLMLVLWYFADSLWLLFVFALIYGTCYGGFVALLPAVTVDYLGVKSAGAIIGALYTSVAIGVLFGPTVAGYAFDFLQSYEAAILVSAALMGVSTLIVVFLNDPATWHARRSRKKAARAG